MWANWIMRTFVYSFLAIIICIPLPALSGQHVAYCGDLFCKGEKDYKYGIVGDRPLSERDTEKLSRCLNGKGTIGDNCGGFHENGSFLFHLGYLNLNNTYAPAMYGNKLTRKNLQGYLSGIMALSSGLGANDALKLLEKSKELICGEIVGKSKEKVGGNLDCSAKNKEESEFDLQFEKVKFNIESTEAMRTSLSRQELIEAQNFLKRAGLYKGDSDGQWGPKVASAIRNWYNQQDHRKTNKTDFKTMIAKEIKKKIAKEKAIAAEQAKREKEMAIAAAKKFEEGMCDDQNNILVDAVSRYIEAKIGTGICEGEYGDQCDGMTLSDIRQYTQILQPSLGDEQSGYLTEKAINELLKYNYGSRQKYQEATAACEAEKQKKIEEEKQKKIDNLFAQIEQDAAKECEGKLSKTRKQKVQIALSKEVGFSGSVDGNLDGTREAIKLWQKSEGLAQTGYVGCEQEKVLIANNTDAILEYAEKQIAEAEAAAKAEEGAEAEFKASQACERDLDLSLRQQLQVALKSEGFYMDEIDGNFDDDFRNSIENWQRSKVKKRTGVIACADIAKLISDNKTEITKYIEKQFDDVFGNLDEPKGCAVSESYKEIEMLLSMLLVGQSIDSFVDMIGKLATKKGTAEIAGMFGLKQDGAAIKRTELQALQFALKEDGLYKSSIDGLWGRGTSGALSKWLATQGYPGERVITANDISCLIVRVVEEIDKNKEKVKEAERKLAEERKRAKEERAKEEERKALIDDILPMPATNNFDPSSCGDLGTKTVTVFGGSSKSKKTVCKTGDEDKDDDGGGGHGGGDDAACFD